MGGLSDSQSCGNQGQLGGELRLRARQALQRPALQLPLPQARALCECRLAPPPPPPLTVIVNLATRARTRAGSCSLAPRVKIDYQGERPQRCGLTARHGAGCTQVYSVDGARAVSEEFRAVSQNG
jgi:hypothetical protein